MEQKEFVRITVLPNGLTVITKHYPHSKTFSLSIGVKAGSINESSRLSGLAHFLEHMLHKGCRRFRTGKSINRQWAVRGLDEVSSAGTSHDYTDFFVENAPLNYLAFCFRMLTEVCLFPLLDKNTIETEKNVVISEHGLDQDSPGGRVIEEALRLLYPNSPLGRPVEGRPNTIRKIQKDDLVTFHANYYHPANMFVVAVGGIKHSQIIALAQQHFGGLEQKKPSGRIIQPGIVSPERQKVITRTALQNTYIAIAIRTPYQAPKESVALELINDILGGSTISRLWFIREKHGLAYDISSNYQSIVGRGFILITTQPRPEHSEKVLKLISTEIEKLFNHGIKTEEFKTAKRRLRAKYYQLINNNAAFLDGVISYWVDQELDILSNYLNLLRRLRLEDVQEVIRRYLDPANYRIAIIAPKSKQ